MDSATVQVKTRVQNEGQSAAECRVTSTILDRDGNPAEGAQVSESQSIAANGEYEFVQQMRVDQPNLWSPENPYLYKVRTSVMDRRAPTRTTRFLGFDGPSSTWTGDSC